MQHSISMHPLTLLQRLHVKAMEHAPAAIVAAAIFAGFGRLMSTNAPLAIAAVLLVATAMWHAGLPQAQRVSRARLAATGLVLFLAMAIAGPEAMAGTIGGMATSLKNDMGAVYNAVIYAFYGGGIVSTGIGVNNGIKKSKGDQQVTTGSIFGYGLGGPALGMVGYIMDNAAGSMGGGASNMNQLPAASN